MCQEHFKQNCVDELQTKISALQKRARKIETIIRWIYIAVGAFIVAWFVASIIAIPGCGSSTGEYPRIAEDASVKEASMSVSDASCVGPAGAFTSQAKLVTATCTNPGDGPISEPFVVEADKPRLPCGEHEIDPEYKEVDGCLITTFKSVTVTKEKYVAKIGLVADCVVWSCYVIWNLDFVDVGTTASY